mmetsp:Transcript_116990/g.377541  ORF Transcript_116990/g.377541 Transcript_116990/m.377541 type:complete len:334 (+) Transcript_116990:154-1155(+)
MPTSAARVVGDNLIARVHEQLAEEVIDVLHVEVGTVRGDIAMLRAASIPLFLEVAVEPPQVVEDAGQPALGDRDVVIGGLHGAVHQIARCLQADVCGDRQRRLRAEDGQLGLHVCVHGLGQLKLRLTGGFLAETRGARRVLEDGDLRLHGLVAQEAAVRLDSDFVAEAGALNAFGLEGHGIGLATDLFLGNGLDGHRELRGSSRTHRRHRPRHGHRDGAEQRLGESRELVSEQVHLGKEANRRRLRGGSQDQPMGRPRERRQLNLAGAGIGRTVCRTTSATSARRASRLPEHPAMAAAPSEQGALSRQGRVVRGVLEVGRVSADWRASSHTSL